MKLVNAVLPGESSPVPGRLRDGEVVDLRGADCTSGDHSPLANAIECLAVSGTEALCSATGPAVDRDEVDLRAPVPEDARVICLGGAYTGHLRERDDPLNRVPSQWIAPDPAVVGPGETIELDERVQSETKPAVELGAVIGRPGRDVAEAAAWDHLAGYTLCNDVTARTDWPGPMGYKLMDTFWPVGPGITPTSAVANPANLDMSIEVDGEAICTGSSAGMRFSLPFLVSYLSQIFELRPGDVISTGDPGDVQGSLESGSTVSVSIEMVGTLTNPVATSD